MKEASFDQPSCTGCLLARKPISAQPLADRNLWQADILHHCPHDGQTTGFGRKGVNLIGTLSHIRPNGVILTVGYLDFAHFSREELF